MNGLKWLVITAPLLKYYARIIGKQKLFTWYTILDMIVREFMTAN